MRSLTGRRRALAAIALGLSAALTLTACAASEEVVTVTVTAPATSGATVTAPGLNGTAGASSAASSADLAAQVRVVAKPAFGSVDLPPNDPVTVTVFAATIKEMTVTADDGVVVAGQIADDGSTWTLTDRLAYNSTYTFAGVMVQADGAEVPLEGTLATVKPQATVRAALQIPSGTTVGIAAPIILSFAEPIADKAAVQRALTVTTSRGEIEGSWGWLQDEDVQGDGTVESIAHYRTREFWPADTDVHVEAKLRGVNLGSGKWGEEDLVSDFKVGRAQKVLADVNSFRMVVSVNDKVVKNYPVSYGKDSVPGRATVSGIHVVTEKYPEFEMCNPQFDYCNLKEKWAVRINNNGEFIHENPKTVQFLGKQNVSHGCINMGPGDAEEFYNSTLYGDPVEVRGTATEMSEKDSIYDWIYSWEEWQGLSAL